jgi:hypothetical protein
MAIQFDQLRQQLTSNPYVQQQNQLQQQMQNLQAQAFSAAGINPAGIFSPESAMQAQAIMQQFQSSPEFQALRQQQSQLNQQMQNDPSFMAMNQQYEQLGQQLNQAEALRQQQFQTSTVLGQPTQSSMLGNMAQNFPGTLGQAPAQGGLGNFMPQKALDVNSPENIASQLAYAQQQRLGGYDQMASQAQQQLMAQRQAQQPIGMQQTQFQRDAMVSPIKPMGAQQAQPQVMGLRQGFNMAGPQAMQSLGGASQQASQPQRLGGI